MVGSGLHGRKGLHMAGGGLRRAWGSSKAGRKTPCEHSGWSLALLPSNVDPPALSPTLLGCISGLLGSSSDDDSSESDSDSDTDEDSEEGEEGQAGTSSAAGAGRGSKGGGAAERYAEVTLMHEGPDGSTITVVQRMSVKQAFPFQMRAADESKGGWGLTGHVSMQHAGMLALHEPGWWLAAGLIMLSAALLPPVHAPARQDEDWASEVVLPMPAAINRLDLATYACVNQQAKARVEERRIRSRSKSQWSREPWGASCGQAR